MTTNDINLNKTDKLILAKLREGRCTPTYLAEELNRDRSYVNQRLKHLREAGIADRVHQGLYKHAELDDSRLDAEEIVSETDREELITCSNESASRDRQPSGESPVGITVVGLQELASNVNAGSKEQTNMVVSVLLDIFWHTVNEGEISTEELKQKIPDVDNRLPGYDFDDYWEYYLGNGRELEKHPDIEQSSHNQIRYTGDCSTLIL